MKDTVTIKIQGKDVIVGYEYDHEEMNLGTGAGDSGHPECTSLDIISIEAKGPDWIDILNSYRLTASLINDIADNVLKEIK